MRLVRQLTRGLRALTNRSATDREIDDEVQHYLAQAAAEHEHGGASRAEAARRARLELGNTTTVREQVRAYGWENIVDSTLADLRYAARRLRSSPGFTFVTTLTLALGIGATTAIFSVVNAILFDPLPYPHPERVVAIRELGTDGVPNGGTFGMYRSLAARARSFDAIAVFRSWQPTVTGRGEPERLEGQRVSAGYFRALGVAPAIGREIDPSDDRLNGPKVVMLSDAAWRRYFGADRAIVGKTVTLDDDSYLVIGIMPASFDNVLAPQALLWAPLQYDLSQGRAWGHHLRTIARLSPGVSVERATREVDAIGHAVLVEQRPETYDPNTRFDATSLRGELTRGVRSALLAILAAVALVLVIASVNVTNLLLARGARRRGEISLRSALGAARGRVMRQLLTETLFLAAIGGTLGLVVAVLGLRALVVLSPAELPRVAAIGIDSSMFAFALVVTTIVGVASGLAPAIQAMRVNPGEDLQQVSRRTIGGLGHTRAALVSSEVAIALVLLVSSGLLLRSVERLFAVDVGFNSSNVLTMQIQATGHRFDAEGATGRFFEQALENVKHVPGVTNAAMTSQLPLSGDADVYGLFFEPEVPNDPGSTRGTFRYAVMGDYFATMGIPLRRGRLLDARDRAGTPLVAVISESMARRRLPGLDPIGRQLRVGPAGPYTVVGIVGDVRQESLALGETDAVYMTPSQWKFEDNPMSLVVQARSDPASLTPAVRAAVWAVDKDQPIVRVATMESLLTGSAASRRFAMRLFEAFGLAALVLAAAGLYGVLAGSVVERWREIGVRSALGASRRDIMGLILRQGLRLTTVGVVIGVGVALLATRLLATLLFGVSHVDPLTYVGVVALLTLTSIVASALPAWRASRVDPVTALRSE
jgi:putative ABC transport system permease protein